MASSITQQIRQLRKLIKPHFRIEFVREELPKEQWEENVIYIYITI